jgi:hypothetical protein
VGAALAFTGSPGAGPIRVANRLFADDLAFFAVAAAAGPWPSSWSEKRGSWMNFSSTVVGTTTTLSFAGLAGLDHFADPDFAGKPSFSRWRSFSSSSSMERMWLT